MALYKYTNTKKYPLKRLLSVISLLMIISGLTISLWVLLPIITFELFYAPKFKTVLRPIPNESLSKTITTELSQVLGKSKIDYTKASYWFPRAASYKISRNNNNYELAIPKLKIENAKVLIGGEDLSQSLIHFTGPNPGDNGNSVIFGHSTLLWLYNPKDYKSIFSKLPDLNLGDIIYINFDNITFKYKVYEMFITSPNDLSVLSQDNNESIITLVTCVPPGTYLKRFIVKARLTKI